MSPNCQMKKISVFKKCQICKKEKQLCRAHIIPQTFKSDLNDGDKKKHLISTSIKERKIRKKQTLKFDKEILCADCDRILGKYEEVLIKFFRSFFKHELRNKIPIPSIPIDIKTDTEKLKLSIAAILYKMSISRRMPDISLGEKYDDIFRIWLQNGSIPQDMKHYLEVIILGYNKDEFDHILMEDPKYTRLEGVPHYVFYLPAFLIIAKVGGRELYSHIDTHNKIGISPNRVKILIADYKDSEYYDFLKKLHKVHHS